MTDTEHTSLEAVFKIMDEMRGKLLALIRDIPLDTIIHTDNHWRLRDILGHLGAWDEAAIRSIAAYKQGGQYVVRHEFTGEDTGEQFNQREYARYSAWSDAQIMGYFTGTREKLKQALASLTPQQWADQMHMPWGQGSLRSPFTLGDGIAGHEDEHYQLIQQWREATEQ